MQAIGYVRRVACSRAPSQALAPCCRRRLHTHRVVREEESSSKSKQAADFIAEITALKKPAKATESAEPKPSLSKDAVAEWLAKMREDRLAREAKKRGQARHQVPSGADPNATITGVNATTAATTVGSDGPSDDPIAASKDFMTRLQEARKAQQTRDQTVPLDTKSYEVADWGETTELDDIYERTLRNVPRNINGYSQGNTNASDYLSKGSGAKGPTPDTLPLFQEKTTGKSKMKQWVDLVKKFERGERAKRSDRNTALHQSGTQLFDLQFEKFSDIVASAIDHLENKPVQTHAFDQLNVWWQPYPSINKDMHVTKGFKKLMDTYEREIVNDLETSLTKDSARISKTLMQAEILTGDFHAAHKRYEAILEEKKNTYIKNLAWEKEQKALGNTIPIIEEPKDEYKADEELEWLTKRSLPPNPTPAQLYAYNRAIEKEKENETAEKAKFKSPEELDLEDKITAMGSAYIDMINILVETSSEFGPDAAEKAIQSFHKTDDLIKMMRADLRQRAIPDTVLDTAAADGPSVDEMKKYNNSLTKAGNALDTFFTPRTLDVLVLATATDPKKTMDALRLMKDVAETFELPITMHTLAIATAACMRAIETPASQFEGQEWYPAKLWVQMEQGLAEHQQGVVDSELSLDVLNLAIKHKRTGTVRSVVQSILSRDVELDLGTFIKIFTLAANMQDGTLADWAHQKLERRNMNMSDPFVTGAMANAYLSTRNYCKVFEIYYFEKKKREKSTLHNTTSPEDSVKSPELLHLPGLLAMHHWDGSNAMEAANQILRSHQSADAICNLLEGVGKHFKLHPDRGTATAVETVALLVQTFASDPQHKQLMSLDSVERLFSDVFHSNPTNHTRMYTFALGVLPERNEKLWAWTRMLDIAATSAANGDLATLTELVDDVLPMMDGLQFTFDDLTQLDTKTRLHAGEKLEVCEKLLDVDQAHRLFKMFGMSE